MRAYFFGNFYLSSIQQGIQAQHCTAEMFLKYQRKPGPAALDLIVWAQEHKTSILLNGGAQKELSAIAAYLTTSSNPYPWTTFNEEMATLNGSLTCVGIILPERVYEAMGEVRQRERRQERDEFAIVAMPASINQFEYGLLVLMSKCGMAR